MQPVSRGLNVGAHSMQHGYSHHGITDQSQGGRAGPGGCCYRIVRNTWGFQIGELTPSLESLKKRKTSSNVCICSSRYRLKIGGLCGCCKYALSFGAMRLSAEDQMWNLKPQFTGFYCLSGSQPHQISNGTVNALVRKVWAPQSWGGDTWKELGPHPSCICLDSGAAPMSLAGRPWNAHICGDQSYKGSWFTIPNYPLSDPKSQGVKNYNILLFF